MEKGQSEYQDGKGDKVTIRMEKGQSEYQDGKGTK